MAVSGIASFGTQILVRSSAEGVTPATWAIVSGVGDIDGPGVTVAETETTSHSTGEPYRTFIQTLIDSGTLSFPVFFNPADPTHSFKSPFGMDYLFHGRTTTDFRLVNTDPAHTTRQFKGYYQELNEAAPVDGCWTKDVTVRIAGKAQVIEAVVTMVPTSSTDVVKAGATATIAVTSSDTLGWSAMATVPWITITAPTAPVVGAGSVSYTVAANPGTTSRSGAIYVGDKTFDVTQLGT